MSDLSLRDPLTGVFNRRYLDHYLSEHYLKAQRQNLPLGVMLCDIDFFKKVNDSFSHAIGDEVLKQVGKIFKQHTRTNDSVARYGGEEFVLIFEGSSLEATSHIAEKLRREVEKYPWQEIHPNLKITISAVVASDLNFGNYEKLLAHADAKLYQAKHQGRNQVCH
ncbi:MAG: GGDEF domain-containing protein [Deinococcales bacterium]